MDNYYRIDFLVGQWDWQQDTLKGGNTCEILKKLLFFFFFKKDEYSPLKICSASLPKDNYMTVELPTNWQVTTSIEFLCNQILHTSFQWYYFLCQPTYFQKFVEKIILSKLK